MDTFSRRRLAENEVIFRRANRGVAEFLTGEGGQAAASPVHFYCECSRLECRERIDMNAQTYNEIHKSNRQFIVIPGHEIPAIETVIRKEPTYLVIEKFGEPPGDEAVNSALKRVAK